MITGNKDIDCLVLLKLNNETLLNFICLYQNKYGEEFWNNFWRNKLIIDFPKRSIGFVNCKNPKYMYQRINKKSQIIVLSDIDFPEIHDILYKLYMKENYFENLEELKNFILPRFQIFRGDTIFVELKGVLNKNFFWDGEKIVDNSLDFCFPEFPIDHFFNYLENTFCYLRKDKLLEAIQNFDMDFTYITDEKGIIYPIFSRYNYSKNEFISLLEKYPYIADCEYITNGENIKKKYVFAF